MTEEMRNETNWIRKLLEVADGMCQPRDEEGDIGTPRNRELQAEFKALTEPLVNWLRANYTPLDEIRIDIDHAYLFSTVRGFYFK